jgi:hypothetical protein
MKSVEHTLRFVTEFDETHPVAQQFLTLDEFAQRAMLESMLREMLAPRLQPILDHINENGTYAILKVAE